MEVQSNGLGAIPRRGYIEVANSYFLQLHFFIFFSTRCTPRCVIMDMKSFYSTFCYLESMIAQLQDAVEEVIDEWNLKNGPAEMAG